MSTYIYNTLTDDAKSYINSFFHNEFLNREFSYLFDFIKKNESDARIWGTDSIIGVAKIQYIFFMVRNSGGFDITVREKVTMPFNYENIPAYWFWVFDTYSIQVPPSARRNGKDSASMKKQAIKTPKTVVSKNIRINSNIDLDKNTFHDYSARGSYYNDDDIYDYYRGNEEERYLRESELTDIIGGRDSSFSALVDYVYDLRV